MHDKALKFLVWIIAKWAFFLIYYHGELGKISLAMHLIQRLHSMNSILRSTKWKAPLFHWAYSLIIEVFYLCLYQKLMSFLFWTVSVFGPCWYKWLRPSAEPAEKCHVSKENHPSEPGSDTRGHSGYHDNYDNRKT